MAMIFNARFFGLIKNLSLHITYHHSSVFCLFDWAYFIFKHFYTDTYYSYTHLDTHR